MHCRINTFFLYLQNELTFSLYLQQPINNTEDIKTTAIGATMSNENDIADGEGGEYEENNVSEEENDSAGGEGEGGDDKVSEEESGSDNNLGGPYKSKCDTHGHMPGTHCLFLHSLQVFTH